MTAQRSNQGQGRAAAGSKVLASLEVQLGGLLDSAELQILSAAIGVGSKPIVDRAIAHVVEMAASRLLNGDQISVHSPRSIVAARSCGPRSAKIILRSRVANKENNTFL